MTQVIFIADFFDDQVTGGAEINDATLVKFLEGKDLLFEKINSHNVTKEYLFKNKDKYFIVSNFVRLSNVCKDFLYHHNTYSIYEHDYKFLINRNPIDFPNFIAPKSFLTNVNFYKRAHCVICLSKMQKEIYENNLNLENLGNIGTSLFTEELVQSLLSLSKREKTKKYAVIRSTNPIKKTQEAIDFCRKNGYEYDLISHENNDKFLEILSAYENLVFMTGHPEPTPRLAIECKLLGVNMIAPRKLIGIASEEWYNTKGEDFVTGLRRIRRDAEKFFLELISEGITRIQDTDVKKVFLGKSPDKNFIEPQSIGTLYKYQNYEEYKKIQIDGYTQKIRSSWVSPNDIQDILSPYIMNHNAEVSFGLCHGTRRGIEQSSFISSFKEHGTEISVIGTEIAPNATTQFPNTIEWDFHNVKDEWIKKVDFIYSNALDHSYDPQMCLDIWMTCLNDKGLCFIEWAKDDEESTRLDPFGASFEEYKTWFQEKYDLVDVLEGSRVNNSYGNKRYYFVLKNKKNNIKGD